MITQKLLIASFSIFIPIIIFYIPYFFLSHLE